ncbi:MAG: hypothetical protein ACR652_13235 [Methylocystis sp.]|uniref:hypothetical protein n=1 Tax=Methylocystis sp. TaxID=1911079 RepID=UPI003DA3320E
MNEERRGDIEIIPPGKEREDDFAASRIWVSSGSGEVRLIRLGPFQSMLLGLGLMTLVGLGLFFLSGLFLILVPAAALLGAGAWVANRLGLGPFRRLR